MSSIGIMDIFKHLPAAKKAENSNCKKCGFPTCMMFAVKLSKSEAEANLCPYLNEELSSILGHSKKVQQLEISFEFRDKIIKIGGEKVMYRHEKTFLNPTPLFVKLDANDANFEKNLKRIAEFKIDSVGTIYTVDGVFIENLDPKSKKLLESFDICYIDSSFLLGLLEVNDTTIKETLDKLIFIRNKAVIERDENFSKPTFVHLKDKNVTILCAKASAYICKYASLLIFDTFNEALFTSLITLRQNIFTDPEMPLQVESKVYEFNNPQEDAYVFLTTNFALSYFAVANELSTLKKGSFLVITPSDGMSVLTAWSAQKITADIASRIVSASNILDIVKNKKLIIPGLLEDLKDELQNVLPDWEIVVGTVEAYKIPDFVKKLEN